MFSSNQKPFNLKEKCFGNKCLLIRKIYIDSLIFLNSYISNSAVYQNQQRFAFEASFLKKQQSISLEKHLEQIKIAIHL
jgi:hypothetical protein